MEYLNPDDLTAPALRKRYKTLYEQYTEIITKCEKSTDEALRKYVKDNHLQTNIFAPAVIQITGETIGKSPPVNTDSDAKKS